MENFIDTHRQLNFYLNILTIIFIPSFGWMIKRWIEKTVGIDLCRSRQAECQRQLGKEYIPRRDLEKELEIIKNLSTTIMSDLNTLNQNLIHHMNGHMRGRQ